MYGRKLLGIFTNFKPWSGQSGLLEDLILALKSGLQTLMDHNESENDKA